MTLVELLESAAVAPATVGFVIQAVSEFANVSGALPSTATTVTNTRDSVVVGLPVSAKVTV